MKYEYRVTSVIDEEDILRLNDNFLSSGWEVVNCVSQYTGKGMVVFTLRKPKPEVIPK